MVGETARIHSFESFGALDGTGIRFVVFFQGCTMRCRSCLNPDTIEPEGGREYSVEEVMSKIRRVKPYILCSKRGGVTASGGECTVQADFIVKLFNECHKEGLTTAVDSCGFTSKEALDKLVPVTDLFMFSIKSFDNQHHKHITSHDNELILENIQYVDRELNKGELWLRYLVFKENLKETEVKALIAFAHKLTKLTRIELLPYSKLGEYKGKELDSDYFFTDHPSPSMDEINELKKRLAEEGFTVV